MMIQFDKTSGPTLGVKPSIRSLHALGAQRNYYQSSSRANPPGLHGDGCLSLRETRQHYSTQCSAAFEPFPSFDEKPLLLAQFKQAALDVLAVLAAFLLTVATGLGIAVSLFFLLFCSF